MNPARRSILRSLIVAPLALVSTAVFAADTPKGSPKFEHSYRAALSAAKKSGKPILVVFSATWCGPCQQMKKDVYPSEAVKPFHDKFVWAYLDADDNDNEKPMKEFKVNGIPHIEFLTAEGKSIGNQVGSTGPESFAKLLEQMLAKAGKKEPAGTTPAATERN
jgi:thiol:disulfide interchange protein